MTQNTHTSQFQQAIEVVESLSADDQLLLIDVIKRRLIEKRRTEIAQAAADTVLAVREDRAKFGDVKDLRKDLGLDE
ncbi:MAG: hypothetical protein ACNA8H_01285 [Anaerolineales bacterium]